ncbi:hypothetical protein [Kosakonia sp. R1.Fl]|uniref:hypothetical protein n=1 Tax=Kosakonia sp. R1.Fl TaxID=2928706 RepID=UPI00201D9B48|nr:hypothetical protein [Kosakonia sp. R1.Fl]MCL6745087.1 hypothetical protein [Kosakonia sp. R1.Fl]
MRLNAKELIADARVTAPTLPPAASKLMTEMADRLDVQFAALCESREQVKRIAVESDFNLHCAARELNTSWMMHRTMLGAQAALLCLSQGDIRSAKDWLEGTTDEAFADMPDDLTPDGLQAWYDRNMTSNDGGNGFLTQEEALVKLRQRAPATDAAIASLRTEGAANAIPEGYALMPKQIHLDADAVECICSQGGDGGYNYGDFTDVVLWVGEVEDDDGSKTHGLNVSSADYPEEGSINLCEFSAQLRSQSEQVKGVQS